MIKNAGLVFADSMEYGPFLAYAREKGGEEFNLRGNDAVTFTLENGDRKLVVTGVKCGIGKVNAALGAAELIRSFSPDTMVSTGVAGGIDKCLGVMDVVVSSSIVYHDVWCGMGCDYGQVQGMPATFPSATALWHKAVALNDSPENNTRIHAGLICTGDQFITNREELDKIKLYLVLILLLFCIIKSWANQKTKMMRLICCVSFLGKLIWS